MDAFGLAEDTVLVLPVTHATLDDSSLELDEAELIALLQPVLDALAGLGLTVATLDPALIGVSDQGQPVLVPIPGAPAEPEQVAGVLAFLQRLAARPPAPARTGVVSTPDPPAPDSAPPAAPAAAPTPPAAPPVPAPIQGDGPSTAPAGQPAPDVARTHARRVPRSTPRSMPRAGLSRTETGAGAGRRASGLARTAALSAVAAGVVLATGYAATSGTAGSGTSSQAQGRTDASSQDDLDEAVSVLKGDPGAVGPDGPTLLRRLEEVRVASGPERAFAAAGALQAITAGVDDGRLDPRAVEPVRAAVTPIAEPKDLDELIDLADQEPAAFGPDTAALLTQLLELRARPEGEPARARAHELWQRVEEDEDDQQVTATFAGLARPVLRDLAVPDDLAGLVEVAADRPSRFGPRTELFAGRLGALRGATEPARSQEAGELLGIVEAGVGKGEFTAAFRDIAVPVLQPLTRAPGT